MTGSNVIFTVEATGDDLQFQWQKNRNNVEETESRLQCSQTDNSSTLHIQSVEKNDKGHYKCLVKNPIDKSGKPSDLAELTVRAREFNLCVQ